MRRPVPRALALLLALAAGGCGRAAPPQVDVVPLADTLDTAGPYELTVAIRSEARIVRAEVRWFVGADAARPVALARQGASDLWKASLPGEPAGTEIRYRVEVQDDEGNVVLRPPADEGDGAYLFRVLPPPSGG